MDEEKIAAFIREGQNRLTNLNHVIGQLDAWADAFTTRGGVEVFGKDAALIAAINDKVQEAVAMEDRITVARLRTDV